MIEKMGWMELGVSSSQMAWLLISQILVAFVAPVIGVMIYHARLARALDLLASRFAESTFLMIPPGKTGSPEPSEKKAA
jgi:hypothetical protein